MDGVLCDYMKAHNEQFSELNPFPQSRIDFEKVKNSYEGTYWLSSITTTL